MFADWAAGGCNRCAIEIVLENYHPGSFLRIHVIEQWSSLINFVFDHRVRKARRESPGSLGGCSHQSPGVYINGLNLE